MNARLKAIEDEGRLGPVFRNVRLDEAAELNDAEFHRQNHAGTRERILKGVSLESLP
jgi:hypothetical protein